MALAPGTVAGLIPWMATATTPLTRVIFGDHAGARSELVFVETETAAASADVEPTAVGVAGAVTQIAGLVT
jgi:hypothetical protein